MTQKGGANPSAQAISRERVSKSMRVQIDKEIGISLKGALFFFTLSLLAYLATREFGIFLMVNALTFIDLWFAFNWRMLKRQQERDRDKREKRRLENF